jgi:hypothetical protein
VNLDALKLVLVSYLGSWPMNFKVILSFHLTHTMQYMLIYPKEYRETCTLYHLSLHNLKLMWEFIYLNHVSNGILLRDSNCVICTFLISALSHHLLLIAVMNILQIWKMKLAVVACLYFSGYENR